MMVGAWLENAVGVPVLAFHLIMPSVSMQAWIDSLHFYMGLPPQKERSQPPTPTLPNGKPVAVHPQPTHSSKLTCVFLLHTDPPKQGSHTPVTRSHTPRVAPQLPAKRQSTPTPRSSDHHPHQHQQQKYPLRADSRVHSRMTNESPNGSSRGEWDAEPAPALKAASPQTQSVRDNSQTPSVKAGTRSPSVLSRQHQQKAQSPSAVSRQQQQPRERLQEESPQRPPAVMKAMTPITNFKPRVSKTLCLPQCDHDCIFL